MYEFTRSRQYTANDKRSSNDFVAIEHIKKCYNIRSLFHVFFKYFLHQKLNAIIFFNKHIAKNKRILTHKGFYKH
jgi:hypothetical protein